MMRLLTLALMAFATLAQAQMYRWVDQDGKVHYGDQRPSPKVAKEVQERKFSAPAADEALPYAVREAMRDFPVTLYVQPNCNSACTSGRDYLKKRGVPFSEKSVTSEGDIAMLKQLLNGEDVSVPVLTVGSRAAKGFLESTWGSLLDVAGYPKSP